LANLAIAQVLGWLGFISISAIWFAAISTCSTFVGNYPHFSVLGNAEMQAVYAGMPGIVITGVAVALVFFGMCLSSYSAHSLGNIKGVGCRQGCCNLRISISFNIDDASAIEVGHHGGRSASERSHLLEGNHGAVSAA
jgi:hypothetical protein